MGSVRLHRVIPYFVTTAAIHLPYIVLLNPNNGKMWILWSFLSLVKNMKLLVCLVELECDPKQFGWQIALGQNKSACF